MEMILVLNGPSFKKKPSNALKTEKCNSSNANKQEEQ